MSYDEHLISLAGGDGELAELRALVRTQQATIDRVRDLANDAGRCGWTLTPNQVREVLQA